MTNSKTSPTPNKFTAFTDCISYESKRGSQSHALNPRLLQALKAMSIVNPTPVQQQAIPLILAGQDVIVKAQTGSGKTAAFGLPVMHALNAKYGQIESGKFRKTRALILAPTRELAIQITDNMVAYNELMNFRILQLIGGARIQGQKNKLLKGVDIVVATPGRILALLSDKSISIKDLEYLIMDEADRMLDMGFSDEINQILKYVPRIRQNLMFSATYPEQVENLMNRIASPNAKYVEIEAEKSKIVHRLFRVSKAQKLDVLIHLLNKSQWSQVIIFTRTKRNANELWWELRDSEFRVGQIHGDKDQKDRSQTMRDFKDKELDILVATDVAARGLDIKQLPCVINYDFPQKAADYVHRVGRTGRAGKSGQAVSFINEAMEHLVPEICELLDIDLKVKASPLKIERKAGEKAEQKKKENAKKNTVKEKRKPKPGGRPTLDFG
jgi:ATP-dependent RNA helicase RhlE